MIKKDSVYSIHAIAFKEVGIELRWDGEGVNEKGIDVSTGEVLVEVDPKYFRPAEVEQLQSLQECHAEESDTYILHNP